MTGAAESADAVVAQVAALAAVILDVDPHGTLDPVRLAERLVARGVSVAAPVESVEVQPCPEIMCSRRHDAAGFHR